MKIKTHGGKRKGSGRPKENPTAVISVRVPEQHAAAIKTKITQIIKAYQQ
jgi:hypothetical protein